MKGNQDCNENLEIVAKMLEYGKIEMNRKQKGMKIKKKTQKSKKKYN